MRVVVPKYARDAGSRVTVCPVRPDPGHFRDQEIPEDRAVGGAMRSFVAHWSDVIVSFLIHHVEPDFENIWLLQRSLTFSDCLRHVKPIGTPNDCSLELVPRPRQNAFHLAMPCVAEWRF